MKFKVEPKDFVLFVIYCIILLYLCALIVVNAVSLLSGTGLTLNPFLAFTPKYIAVTIILFLGVLVTIFLSVSSYIFDKDKGHGFGLKIQEKKESGYERWATDKEMKNAKWKFASLDKKVKGADEEETTLLHMVKDEKSLTPEDQFISKESVCNLYSVIDKLKHTEQAVIIMRYGLNGENPMSLSEVGNVIGCSKERVRQIETKAIKLLRNCLDANIAA